MSGNYPDSFYFLEEDAVSYHASPPGNLDVLRLINDKPCFEAALRSKQPKQKTLVLADWTAKNWSYRKTEKIAAAMEKLIENNFTIYLWQSNKLVPLKSPHSLHDPKVQKHMTLEYPEEIHKLAAIEEGIPSEQLQIIDDQGLASLLDDTLPIDRPRELNISDYSPELETKIQTIFLKNNPSPIILHDEFDESTELDNKLISRLMSSNNKVVLKKQFQKLRISMELLYRLLEDKPCSSKKNPISLADLKSIKKIVICNSRMDLTLAQFKKLCDIAPELEDVTLYLDLKGSFDDAPNFEKINELTYGNSVLYSAKCLNQLIEHLPNLKVLNLLYVIFEDGAEDDLEFKKNLFTLEELSILFCGKLDINLFLAATPKLKKLITEEPIKSITTKLPYLEELVLRKSEDKNINNDSLNKIFEIAPNLKKLTIPRQVDKWNALGFIKYHSLEELNIANSQIESLRDLISSFASILNCFPHIKKIIVTPLQLRQLERAAWFPKFRHLIELELLLLPLYDIAEEDKSTFTPIPEIKDPIHQVSNHLDFKPRTEFTFSGLNKTKNQAMIIEKLSQYWTLTQPEQKAAMIIKIQDGICNALTHLFLEKGAEWDNLIDPLLQWDGSKEELEKNKLRLEAAFSIITDAIKRYHHTGNSNSYYIGNNLPELLKIRKSHIIKNPWHVVAIIPAGPLPEEKVPAWTLYDPNGIAGPKRVLESELGEIIRKQIGEILSVNQDSEEKAPNVPIVIPSAANFIEQGGLWMLCRTNNRQDILNILKKSNEPFSASALNGLLLRDTRGIPAWAQSLKEPDIAAYSFNLLQQFISLHDDAISLLHKSLINMNPMEQHGVIELLLKQKRSKKIDQLIEALHTNPQTDYYAKRLQTWKKNLPEPVSLRKYLKQLTAAVPHEKNSLVQLKSSRKLQGLQLALQKYCQDTSRPVFYVNSPDDLICSSRSIERDDKNFGTIKKPPCGPLYNFIQKNLNKSPMIIVNYDNFTASDMVRFNALLDEKPNADGESLPENTKVIGLININKPDCYQGADFYSRFSKREVCTLCDQSLAIPDLPFINEAKGSSPPFKIPLYGTDDWKAILLGSWKIKNDRLVFEEGLLEQAFRTKNFTLEITNGPWSNPEFQSIWEQACMLGYIQHSGRKIEVPAKLSLIKSEGYDWTIKKKKLTFHEGILLEDIPVLNPSLFIDFFSRYQVDNEKHSLNHIPGWIEQFANKKLTVNLTAALSEAQWARITDGCKQYNVDLVVHYDLAVALPEKLHAKEEVRERKELKFPEHTKKITSSDMDVTIAELSPTDNWKVIDVSECHASDLLLNTEAKWDEAKQCFQFKQTPAFLLNALKDKENIVLKGRFSPELTDALQPLLIKRLASTDASGKLILLSQDPEAKASALSLCQLQAKAVYQRALGSDPWVGMRSLPPSSVDDRKIDYQASKTIADTFTKDRINTVNSVLSVQPFVFLTGITGVGKSTFVQKDFLEELKEEKGVLYQGEEEIKKWAEDNGPGIKILFIDEANLSPRQWSEFEGLFQKKPGILIKGKYYPLTENHKVIFAGNPISYGGERQLAPLFERHGNAVLFKPLPPEHIYQAILKPIWENTPLQSQMVPVSDILLNLYRFLNRCSREKVLISPREIQMMALLIVADVIDNKTDMLASAEHFAYTIGKTLVPNTYKDEFDTLFQPKYSRPEEEIKATPHFLITESRKPAAIFLSNLLHLREWRGKNKATASPEQLYGGMGGFILEGSPASGKSELVIAQLLASGYKEMHAESKLSQKDVQQKIFYRIPVSKSMAEKKALLLKAFHEGAVVVIDEINSSPMMERLLNALTMGVTPEGDRPPDNRPDMPGFMIIGTQNPITMTGRRAPSTALARRLITVSVPDYTAEELVQILVSKGTNERQANQLVIEYQKQCQKATEEHLSPAPTPRDLINLAKELLLINSPLKEEKGMPAPPKIEKTKGIKLSWSLSKKPTTISSTSEKDEVNTTTPFKNLRIN